MFNHDSLNPRGSFRGRQEEKWGSFQGWGSFRGRDHFGGCTDPLNNSTHNLKIITTLRMTKSTVNTIIR